MRYFLWCDNNICIVIISVFVMYYCVVYSIWNICDMMVYIDGNVSFILYMVWNGMFFILLVGMDSRGSFFFVCILNVER